MDKTIGSANIEEKELVRRKPQLPVTQLIMVQLKEFPAVTQR